MTNGNPYDEDPMKIIKSPTNELAPTTDSQTSLDKVMEALQAKVLGEGGVVSSEDTGFEKAIAGIKEAGTLTGERIESRAGREIDYATGQANVHRTQQLEGRRGYATQKVALKLLEESNIKYIGDLQRQKDDALLANDAETARQVAGMQMEAMRYEQQEKQNYFSNLLSVGQMAISTQQLQEQIRMNAQSMSQFDWQKTMDQSMLNFQQSKFDYEKIQNKAILNQHAIENKLREQEMLLRYGDDINKVQPDEGFADVNWQMTVAGMVAPLQTNLAEEVKSGAVGVEEIEEEMDRIIRKLRNLGVPESAASDEALRRLLSIEQEDMPEELPTYVGAKTVPAWRFGRSVIGTIEKPGEWLTEFMTGKRPTGLVD